MKDEKKGDLYIVMFVEDDFCFNADALVTSPGERRLVCKIYAENPRDAYFEGVRRAKEKLTNTFRLGLCKKKDLIGKV